MEGGGGDGTLDEGSEPPIHDLVGDLSEEVSREVEILPL
jgi:hypothetical protein